jgi:hypothetical protein
VTTVDAAELAELVGMQGINIKSGTAEMFLHWWITTGLVEEPLPGRYRLTDEGRRVAAGLLDAEHVEEQAA